MTTQPLGDDGRPLSGEDLMTHLAEVSHRSDHAVRDRLRVSDEHAAVRDGALGPDAPAQGPADGTA